jgi:colanic acid/amylovoran biosynthesis glycosyltransferase
MKDQLVELGFPENRLQVVYFGLDPDAFPFREEHSLIGRVMMVGRMVEKKGFPDAIDAVRIAVSEGLDLHLDLFGDGPLRPSLQARAREAGLEDRITFHGMQSMNRIRNAHRQSDLLLAPSTTAADGDEEGLPNTILEAMSAGLPVVTTNHAAIPEAVQDRVSGFIAPERDPHALAGILRHIYRDGSDLEPIRRAARDVILRQHSIDSMVDAVESIYHHLTTSRHGTVPRPTNPETIPLPPAL